MSIRNFRDTTFNPAKTREVMGVIIVDSGTETTVDKVAKPTALVPETAPLAGQDIKERQAMKMAIEPAPRKSGTLNTGGDAPASDAQVIGPPDAKITSGSPGLGKIILIGVAVLTLFVLLGGRKS